MVKGSEVCHNLANYKTNYHYSIICEKELLLECLELHTKDIFKIELKGSPIKTILANS